MAHAAILDGQTATGPRGLASGSKKSFPKTEWVEKRWAASEDGRLWISGEC